MVVVERSSLRIVTVERFGRVFDQVPHEMESQLLHKIVNLVFTITDRNNKFTVVWGSDFLKPTASP